MISLEASNHALLVGVLPVEPPLSISVISSVL